MNTIRSVGYGWGVLIVAGGGSYYFAKRSINRDREERALADQRRRAAQHRLREIDPYQGQYQQHPISSKTSTSSSAATPRPTRKDKGATGAPAPVDERDDPSKEPHTDSAPMSHAQEEPVKKGKYEASEPYRSRKGDRFS